MVVYGGQCNALFLCHVLLTKRCVRHGVAVSFSPRQKHFLLNKKHSVPHIDTQRRTAHFLRKFAHQKRHFLHLIHINTKNDFKPYTQTASLCFLAKDGITPSFLTIALQLRIIPRLLSCFLCPQPSVSQQRRCLHARCAGLSVSSTLYHTPCSIFVVTLAPRPSPTVLLSPLP